MTADVSGLSAIPYGEERLFDLSVGHIGLLSWKQRIKDPD